MNTKSRGSLAESRDWLLFLDHLRKRKNEASSFIGIVTVFTPLLSTGVVPTGVHMISESEVLTSSVNPGVFVQLTSTLLPAALMARMGEITFATWPKSRISPT